jgi:hypothetical protein
MRNSMKFFQLAMVESIAVEWKSTESTIPNNNERIEIG